MPLGITDNLLKRIIAAVVLIPPVVAIILAGGWWFSGLAAVGGSIILLEWFNLTKVRYPLLKASAILFLLAIVSLGMEIAGVEGVIVNFLLVLGLPLLLVLTSLKDTDPYDHHVIYIMRWSAQGTLYAALPILSLIWMRGLNSGEWLVFWVFLIVWGTDIGGYFAGKGIGGPKLAPKISPKKTWSGLLGGMVLSALASLGLSLYTGWGDWITIMSIGAVLAVVSQFGDLFESAIKRAFNVKDSGSLIPGHGGIMDRVDGLIFVAPAMAILFDLGYLAL